MAANTYLLILSQARGLSFVLTEQRMAFPEGSRRPDLKTGDVFFLYITRSALHSTHPARSRIVGRAVVKSSLRTLDKVFAISGRRFAYDCDLRITGLAPLGEGLPLKDFVPQMEVFPLEHAWSAKLRRSILLLPEHDTQLIEHELAPLLKSPKATMGAYIERAERQGSRKS
jgi:hypothetical protein